jgi:hypothetical protein
MPFQTAKEEDPEPPSHKCNRCGEGFRCGDFTCFEKLRSMDMDSILNYSQYAQFFHTNTSLVSKEPKGKPPLPTIHGQ